MAKAAMRVATLMAVGVAAQQDATVLLQSTISTDESQFMIGGFDGYFMEGAFGLLPDDAPEWCKNETQLTWKQRKDRMQQHATLEWAKKMAQQLITENSTVPEWMDKMVSDDEKRGKSKWAVQESKRLKAEGKETPQWMDDLVAEENKWANRWAACKTAELKGHGEEVPAWMVENGRKGVMEAASEKAAEIQEQLDELDEQREQEVALVDAKGDAQVASQRMLARTKEAKTRTMNQQFHILESALEELDNAEGEMLKEGPAASAKKVKQVLRRAQSASELLGKILERKAQLLLNQMENATPKHPSLASGQ